MYDDKFARERVYEEVHRSLVANTEVELKDTKIELKRAYEGLIECCILRSIASDDEKARLASEIDAGVQAVRDAASRVRSLRHRLEKLEQYSLNGFDEQIADIRKRIWE
jgi:hypothetical protein